MNKLNKLTIHEVFLELLKIKNTVSDLLVATADYGVEKGGEPERWRRSGLPLDVHMVESLSKEIRNDVLTIRSRCFIGFEGRNDGRIVSKLKRRKRKNGKVERS